MASGNARALDITSVGIRRLTNAEGRLRMAYCIVSTADTRLLSHRAVRSRRCFRIAIATARIAMVERIAVVPIPMMIPTRMNIPERRIVAPIVRRGPANPTRSPEPIVDDRTVDIHRLNNIVFTIDIFISHDLHLHIVRLILDDKDRCYILVDILGQDSLQDDQVLRTGTGLNHTDIVDIAITIEIQVGKSRIRVVEDSLKLLKVSSTSK